MHTSLDGYVAGPNGELNWAKLDEDILDLVATMTENADTAVYGRVTYELMESYWPKAGEQPNASKHTIEHAKWYSQISKVVLSKTMSDTGLNNIKVIGEDISKRINELKQQEGKSMLVFGSPTASIALLNLGLVDELLLFVNPIILGNGKPLFKNVKEKTILKLVASKSFFSGVLGLHYKIIREQME